MTAAPAAEGRRRVSVYRPPRRHDPRLRELWAYRGLLRYFGKVFVEKRYRRTWLGWLWIPLRPSADIAGRVFLFGALLGVSSGDRPYFMFFIVGAGAWRFFATGVIWATRALDLNRGLFRQANVPRASAVIAGIVPGAVEATIYAAIAAVAAVYFKLSHGTFYLVLDAGILSALAGTALLALYVVAVGLWTAPLAYHARDVRFLLTYALGLWFVITPVIYPISAIPEKFRPLAEWNPLTAPIELVKSGILQTAPPTQTSLQVSLTVLAVVLGAGAVTFARAEAAANEAG